MATIGGQAADYDPGKVARVIPTCLTIAQVLGDELMGHTVIVGGLVPTLLYSGAEPAAEIGPHIGTMDVDLVLDLFILEEGVYEAIEDRLKRARFEPVMNDGGNIRRQKWRTPNGVTIDFLMPPTGTVESGKPQSLTKDFAAIVMDGLDLALEYAVPVQLVGRDLADQKVSRSIPVCPPHIFVALKAVARADRDVNKDAYDMYFVLKNDKTEPRELGAQLREFATRDVIQQAITSIERDNIEIDGRGPRSVCRFLGRDGDDELAGDVLAHATSFLGGFRGA